MSHRSAPQLISRAIAAAQQGRIAEAFQLLTQGVESGHAQAALTLAHWRLAGDPIRRDLFAARDLFGTAAELGLAEAEPIHIALLANGAGGAGRRWGEALQRLGQRASKNALARRQAELISAMAIDAEGDPSGLPEAAVQSSVPEISIRRGFLSAAECRYLIDLAGPQLQPSIVVHPQTGEQLRDPVRTADFAAFPFVLEDPAIHALNRRIMASTGTSYEQGEPVQVLSYQPGQEYKLHSDCLPPGNNQRVQTFLVALTDQFEGGETAFPRIDLKLRVAAGDAIQFVNVDARGQPEPLARHAGLPVLAGRKLMLSKWIRATPLDLSGPPGRPF